MNITCSVDTSSLNDALNEAQKWSHRTREKCVVTAAVAVCDRAYELTPAETVAKIDLDLGTIITVKTGKLGQSLSAKYSKNVIKAGGRMGDKETVQNVPLAVLIIAAQAKPGSRYNALTGNRFARGANPFKGVSRAEGRAAMQAAENRLINARHGTPGFLRLGFAAARKMLRKLVYGGGPPVEGEDISNETFGRATRQDSRNETSVTIENLIGMVNGKQGDNGPNYNQAMLAKAGPALQQAVDDVAADKIAHVLEKELTEFKPKWDSFR
jgi:hypothetical protein